MKNLIKTQEKTNKNTGLNSLDYRIIEFKPSLASDFEWGKFFDIREKLHYEHSVMTMKMKKEKMSAVLLFIK